MKKSNRSIRGIAFYFMLLGIFIVGLAYSSYADRNQQVDTYADFCGWLEAGRVKAVYITPNEETPTGLVQVQLTNSEIHSFYAVDILRVEEKAEEYQVRVVVQDVDKPSWFWTLVFPYLVILIAVIIVFMVLGHSLGGGGSNSQVLNFGKSRAQMTDGKDNPTTFKDVAGLQEEKEELQEVVDFLANPKQFIRVGARIPKGILMEGPPGTGKTLLAKAVAGEAGVPFFSISGSDFVEMFVGVGASRVRDLFVVAKKNAPCIIFIDEIDAVARRRGAGLGGGHDEREQTLNQLLVEMDGFGVNEGIIVLAATNRVDILDPAILRPGRFDRKVMVGRPDVRGRLEILKVHVRNKPLSEDVNLEHIARSTAGFSGADLENLMNEAAINAAKENRAFINYDDVKRALIRVGIGTEKKSRIISDKEKRITAFHEAGHAILFHVLPDVGPVYTVSIIPTGNGAAGYTMPLPGEDEMFRTRGEMLQEIIVSLGGRVAEELVFEDITTGASQDIKQATGMAQAMVTKYGFSDALGPVNYGTDEDEVFIGRDYGHTKSYSESVANKIDEEVRRIIDECYAEAKRIVSENREILDQCAELLLQKERITREEFEALFGIVPEAEAVPAVTEISLDETEENAEQ
ncbi:MAG: ATP-dependent zinc metalloprotease FtsH [Lachnospiraceae bacterium]|nr:ATP-dependent zinc metalloprotease FtsH [Lachnospiraceae bacterium]